MPVQDYINRARGYLQDSTKRRKASCARQGSSRGRGRLRGGWPVTGTTATASQSAGVRALVLDGNTLLQYIRGKIIPAAPPPTCPRMDYSNKWSAGRSNAGQAKQQWRLRREEDEGLHRLMSVFYSGNGQTSGSEAEDARRTSRRLAQRSNRK
jgi:hypothetical protein